MCIKIFDEVYPYQNQIIFSPLITVSNQFFCKCELTEAVDREMIVTLEDFLRRRSKLALVVQNEDLKKSDGLKEACKILFAEDAADRWEEYFDEKF